ncbi:MAG: PKD domain-containing protein [Acidobacteria bacterium]|nr:PKD domain-containing protein [Acidobacteriota bacterium]
MISLVSACDKVPLLAPSGTVITLFPTATSVPINGEIEIIATVIENGVTTAPPSTGTGPGTGPGAGAGTPTTTTTQPGAGTPVQNGTLVSFTTTIGRIEPTEARTHNGQVRVKFISNGQSGLATVTAFSGGASGRIENLSVGTAAAGRIVVTSSQGLGPAGGTTEVRARVEDASGTPLRGIPVTFRTNAGTLSSTTATTDETGVAVVTLTTNRNATVTASAGSQTSDLNIALSARLINTVTPSPPSTTVGTPVAFSIVSPTEANITDATINFGDGQSQSLGSFNGTTTASHVYNAPGSYTVSVTARDALNTTQTQTTSVTIGSLALTLNAQPNPAAPNSPVTFVAVGTSGAQVRAYRWTFGDGSVVETSGPQTSHSYSQRGNYNVQVEVIGLSGAVVASQNTTVTISGL